MFADGSLMNGADWKAFVQANTPRSHVQKLGDTVVFQCSANAAEDETELLAAMRNELPQGGVVLDLARLDAIDPSHLGSLVSVAQFANRNAILLKLMNVRPCVEAFLRENNLLAVFAMCSPREAISLWCRSVRQRNQQFSAG
jgi:anti-anti-sigma regulatory factor